MKRNVLITGCLGGIGKCLVEAFVKNGDHVVGVDRLPMPKPAPTFSFLQADIGEFARTPASISAFEKNIRAACGDTPLSVIINNAAVQHLGRLGNLAADAILETLDVNVAAPMLIAKAFLPDLEQSRGVILNIGSVHAEATKQGFAAYATSKAALHGMTRALAVDLGPAVRVNALAPAATRTEMLEAGFAGDEKGLSAVADAHPVRRIADPEEIATLAVFLAGTDASFLTGTTVYADGGVLSRLHDPA